MKFLTLLLTLLLLPATAFAQDAYVSGIDDLPLMPGLAQPAGDQAELDEPEGRIVEASAAGLITPDAVAKYYAVTLPQLGWQQVDGEHYAREGEDLTIEPISMPPGTTVRFSLKPIAALE